MEQHDVIVQPPNEELYSNVNKNVEHQETNIKSVEPIEEKVNDPQSPVKEQVPTTEEPNQHIDPIYQNQEDLTEYIEDTGVKAVKLLISNRL